eukprot:1151120-Pelagomonas_calceolata.AAC.3
MQMLSASVSRAIMFNICNQIETKSMIALVAMLQGSHSHRQTPPIEKEKEDYKPGSQPLTQAAASHRYVDSACGMHFSWFPAHTWSASVHVKAGLNLHPKRGFACSMHLSERMHACTH